MKSVPKIIPVGHFLGVVTLAIRLQLEVEVLLLITFGQLLRTGYPFGNISGKYGIT
jgi:hypothetical protein